MAKILELDDRTATCADEPSLLQWGRDRYNTIAKMHGLDPEACTRNEVNSSYEVRLLFDQLIPVRDVLPRLWRLPDRGDESRGLAVVSTHTSKSVLLPVYRLEVPNVGVFHMRNNFYDWGLSCALEFRVPSGLWGDMFNTAKSDSFLEGFDQSWKYEPFVGNQQRFSLMLSPQFESLYAFMFTLRLHAITLGLVEPYVYS